MTHSVFLPQIMSPIYMANMAWYWPGYRSSLLTSWLCKLKIWGHCWIMNWNKTYYIKSMWKSWLKTILTIMSIYIVYRISWGIPHIFMRQNLGCLSMQPLKSIKSKMRAEIPTGSCPSVHYQIINFVSCLTPNVENTII